MGEWVRKFLLLSVLLWNGIALAAIDAYEFRNDNLRERYHQLAEELRCPKCQNQNIMDSNSPIATDLRRELHRLLHEGRSDQQVVDYMVERYGDFVMYRPPVKPVTYMLWFAPLVMLAIGFLILVLFARRRQRLARQAGDHLDEAEQARLNALLNEDKDRSS